MHDYGLKYAFHINAIRKNYFNVLYCKKLNVLSVKNKCHGCVFDCKLIDKNLFV